jgi:hypothetical protein
MESAIATRISYYMEHHMVLPKLHVGGRKMRSVDHALHLLTERIHSIISTYNPKLSKKHNVALVLMLDVSGAFDNVSHARLLHNLRKWRIPLRVVQWVKSFL